MAPLRLLAVFPDRFNAAPTGASEANHVLNNKGMHQPSCNGRS